MFSYICNVTETFSIRRLVHLRVLPPFSWAGGRGEGGGETRPGLSIFTTFWGGASSKRLLK